MENLKVSRTYTDNTTEEEVHRKIAKDQFLQHFRKENIKFSDTDKEKQNYIDAIDKFNLFIKKTRAIFEMEIFEILTFLDEEGYKLEKTYDLLSAENSKILKKEIYHKYSSRDSIKLKYQQGEFEEIE